MLGVRAKTRSTHTTALIAEEETKKFFFFRNLEKPENLFKQLLGLPIPVAERSKAWVCSRSPAEIAGSNPAEGMDVCLL